MYLPSSHSGGWLPGNHRGLSLLGSWGSVGVGAWTAEIVVSPLVAAATLVTLNALPPKKDVLAAPTLLATLLHGHSVDTLSIAGNNPTSIYPLRGALTDNVGTQCYSEAQNSQTKNSESALAEETTEVPVSEHAGHVQCKVKTRPSNAWVLNLLPNWRERWY
jgi:hypothetical protein